MMNALASSIVALYENEGLSVESIASTQDIEPITVKAVLLQHSGRYREVLKLAKDSGVPKELLSIPDSSGLVIEEDTANPLSDLITEEESLQFLQRYKELALYAENEAVSERACKNLINLKNKITDGLGENDAKKLMKSAFAPGRGVVNIIQFNENLNASRKAKEQLMSNTTMPLLKAIEG